MSINSKKNKWSWSLIWSYVISVTTVYLLVPIIAFVCYRISQKPFQIREFYSLESWLTMLLLQIPVILLVIWSKTAGKASLFAFLVYFCLGCFIQLLAIGWGGGTTFDGGYFLFSFVAGLIAASCSWLMLLTWNKISSKS